MVGWTEWLVIGSLIFLVFSIRKVPDLLLNVVQAFRQVKKEIKGDEENKQVRDLNSPSEGPRG